LVYVAGKSGLYLVAESIDCGGKGSIISAIKDSEVRAGRLVVDLRLLWPSDEPGKVPSGPGNALWECYENDDVIPDYSKLKDHFTDADGRKIGSIFVCEPTWAHVGLAIRRKIIHEVAGKNYTAKDTAQAYADDREELIRKLIKPAIDDGVDVYCERNFCSSVVYQSSMDNPVSVEDIMRLPGNAFAARNAPHLYVICDLSAETAMKRKLERQKQDNCKFEVPEFQRRIEGKYRSSWLHALLTYHGSMVVYVNTDSPTTLDDTVRASLEIVKRFKSGSLRDKEKFNFRKR
jgi:thymidylate kinase